MLKQIKPNYFLAFCGICLLWLTHFSIAANDIKMGGWDKANYETTGQWKLMEKNGSWMLYLDENFKTEEGPDLYVALSELKADQVKNNVPEGRRIDIGLLKSNGGFFSSSISGPQEFQIGNLDISKYKSILIYCKAYSKLWAASDLK